MTTTLPHYLITSLPLPLPHYLTTTTSLPHHHHLTTSLKVIVIAEDNDSYAPGPLRTVVGRQGAEGQGAEGQGTTSTADLDLQVRRSPYLALI